MVILLESFLVSARSLAAMSSKKSKSFSTATPKPPLPSDDPRLAGLSTIEQSKLQAAYLAVDENVKSGQIIGVGSGSTVVYAVNRLKERFEKENLSIVCIPTSFQARELIRNAGMPLGSLDTHPVIDVAIDGADEVDENLDLIKGGGGCHVQEKIIASNAKSFVVVADDRKISPLLGTNWNKGIPIEAIPANYVPLLKKLTDLGGKPVLRMAKSKAGPVVSDNGNFIIDVDFGPLDGKNSPALMEQRLRMLTGVVDVGLFVGMASKAYFGHRDGSMSFRSVNTS
eukprot:m.213738 g.213738  ORF g.213738 m.213738 type:complete len:284 (+) comp26177_c0_seq6:186-1037(+)